MQKIETIIRKKWRNALFLSTIPTIISTISEFKALGSNIWTWCDMAFSITIAILLLCISYYFVEKKRGTKWLAMKMLIMSFTLMQIICEIHTHDPRSIKTLCLAVQWIFFLNFLFQSYRIYLLNEAFQANKSDGSQSKTRRFFPRFAKFFKATYITQII